MTELLVHELLSFLSGFAVEPDEDSAAGMATITARVGEDRFYNIKNQLAVESKQEPSEDESGGTVDDLLLQEIYSLREKLKIAVAAIKSYDPDFDDREFTHRLGAVDHDQLMEELATESKQEPSEEHARYPQATEPHREIGWTLDYDFLTRVAEEAWHETEGEGSYSMEAVEFILLKAEEIISERNNAAALITARDATIEKRVREECADRAEVFRKQYGFTFGADTFIDGLRAAILGRGQG